ncbi:hypothetical protein FDECE_9553 [Fusarium decemcellulare]|nr:hypothetical protein FDECE_9553 [Fusarium decemcellulare]
MDDNTSEPNLEIEAQPDDALMAQMGFSSFGATSPPSKRRRYNPRADASLPPKPVSSKITGANSTALGSRANTDEISLDDDESESAQSPAQARPASLPQRPAPAAQTAFTPRLGQHSAPREVNNTWYIGYYDPMSNENPWERLEKTRGVQTRGTWLPRDANASATTTTGAPA